MILSIMDASVVDLPLPVGPVTRTSPRGLSVMSSTALGRPSSPSVFISCGMVLKAAPMVPFWK